MSRTELLTSLRSLGRQQQDVLGGYNECADRLRNARVAYCHHMMIANDVFALPFWPASATWFTTCWVACPKAFAVIRRKTRILWVSCSRVRGKRKASRVGEEKDGGCKANGMNREKKVSATHQQYNHKQYTNSLWNTRVAYYLAA